MICSVAAPTKLKIAYPTTVGSMAVLWMTKEAKLFEKHELEVELIYIAGSSRVVQAMLAKDIPISEIAITAVIQANLAGADLCRVDPDGRLAGIASRTIDGGMLLRRCIYRLRNSAIVC